MRKWLKELTKVGSKIKDLNLDMNNLKSNKFTISRFLIDELMIIIFLEQRGENNKNFTKILNVYCEYFYEHGDPVAQIILYRKLLEEHNDVKLFDKLEKRNKHEINLEKITKSFLQ